MKSIETKVNRVIVAKLEPGDEVLDSMMELVKKHEIKAGLINIIGAFSKFTIGYFDLDTKKYKMRTFEEDVEWLSCMGNITYKEDDPIIHLHTLVGREDYSILGGHLGQPTLISVTGEVFIYEVAEKIRRSKDEKTQLTLLDL